MTMRAALIAAVAAALLSGCAAVGKSQQKLLEETLDAYAAAVRWSNFEQAATFIDPKTLEQHPITPLELQRLKQVQVTYYNDQPPREAGEDQVREVVEIGLVNVHTQAARAVVDNQLWRFDPQQRRWWLVSGLPKITAP